MNWTRGPPCWYIRNISSTPGDLITRPAARDLRVGCCMWWVYYGRCWWISMFMESLRRGWRNKNTTVNNRHYDVQLKALLWWNSHIMCFWCVFFVFVCVCFFVPIVKRMILMFFGVCLFKMMQTLLMNLQQILFIKWDRPWKSQTIKIILPNFGCLKESFLMVFGLSGKYQPSNHPF